MIEERIKYLKASIKDCEHQISKYRNKSKLLLLKEDKICYFNELQWLEQLKEYLEKENKVSTGCFDCDDQYYHSLINELLGESKESND